MWESVFKSGEKAGWRDIRRHPEGCSKRRRQIDEKDSLGRVHKRTQVGAQGKGANLARRILPSNHQKNLFFRRTGNCELAAENCSKAESIP
jgi:hypothetical protein